MANLGDAVHDRLQLARDAGEGPQKLPSASALCNARDKLMNDTRCFAFHHVTPYGLLVASNGRGTSTAQETVLFGKQWEHVSQVAQVRLSSCCSITRARMGASLLAYASMQARNHASMSLSEILATLQPLAK